MSNPSTARNPRLPHRIKPVIAILDAPGAGYVGNAEIERRVIASHGEAQPYIVPDHERSQLPELDADYVILWHRISLDAAFFERNKTCRAVVCASVGYDHVDIEAARANGVPVYHVPHYGTEEVADHTLALFLALARRLSNLRSHVREGGWDWRTIGEPRRLRGSVWGIIGLGRIGLAVAERAKAFGMHVIFHDPYNHPGIEKSLGIERCSDLNTLLEQSDTVSLHVPLDADTHHLLNRDRLSRMKQGAALINTARGALVDLGALQDALAEGHPAFAALDVVEGEPSIPAWIRNHPQVLLSPHAAFFSVESLIELRTRGAEAVVQMINGAPISSAIPVP